MKPLASDISTNEQKKDWFLRLDPNGRFTGSSSSTSFPNALLLGRIPVIVDNTQSPPFPVMETSAELLYLLKLADKDDKFGFKDELERNEALQWYAAYKSPIAFELDLDAEIGIEKALLLARERCTLPGSDEPL